MYDLRDTNGRPTWIRRTAHRNPDHIALALENMAKVPHLMTTTEIARQLMTTPGIVRLMLRRERVEPARGRIYYSPFDVIRLLRRTLVEIGDERASLIPTGGSTWLAHPYRRRQKSGFIDRMTPDRAAPIERRAAGFGQWVSATEAAEILGVSITTLARWRKKRAADDRTPAFFRSEPREPRLPDQPRSDWQRSRTEYTPTSRRDPSTGQAIERAAGRYAPVVYDRNLLVAWVRRWALR